MSWGIFQYPPKMLIQWEDFCGDIIIQCLVLSLFGKSHFINQILGTLLLQLY